MTDHETDLITTEIINRALEGDPVTFQTIRYWNEFKYFRRWIITDRILIRALTQSADCLFKRYCKNVIAGISDFTELLAYQQLLDIIDFYKDELKTVKAMVDDYDEYLCNFRNLIQALSGERRED